MSPILAALFCITALLYASVGFGGGSTYNALLVLNGTDYRVLPSLALICNIIVVAGSCWRFHRGGLLPWRGMAPFLVTSIPAAFIGGRLVVSETLFVGLLGFALLIAGIRLAFQPNTEIGAPVPASGMQPIPYLVGAGIGLLSGMVGIGGGIFLAPVLYFLRWDTPRRIAAACSLFILVNSLSGLTGQILKLHDLDIVSALTPYWALFPAVLIGGQIGSWLASARLEPGLIKRATAILILYVAVRLIYRWLTMRGWLG